MFAIWTTPCPLHLWGLPMLAKLYCLYYFCWLKNIPLPDGYGRALGRWRQVDLHEVEASLLFIVKHCLKTTATATKLKETSRNIIFYVSYIESALI